MHRELLSHSPLLILPIAAMFVFIAVFLAVLIRTMSKRASTYDNRAALPFSEETPNE
jgi:hypothetical protein